MGARGGDVAITVLFANRRFALEWSQQDDVGASVLALFQANQKLDMPYVARRGDIEAVEGYVSVAAVNVPFGE